MGDLLITSVFGVYLVLLYGLYLFLLITGEDRHDNFSTERKIPVVNTLSCISLQQIKRQHKLFHRDVEETHRKESIIKVGSCLLSVDQNAMQPQFTLHLSEKCETKQTRGRRWSAHRDVLCRDLPALSCSTVQLEAVKGHSLSDTRATLDWRRCQLIFPFFLKKKKKKQTEGWEKLIQPSVCIGTYWWEFIQIVRPF